MLLIFGCAAISLGFLMAGHYPPWTSFENEWIAGAGALLTGAAALADKRSFGAQRLPLLAATAAALACVPLLQYVAGQVWFLSDAALSATYLLAFAACIVAGQVLGNHRAAAFVEGLMGALLAAALVSTAIALLQWLEFRGSIFVVEQQPGGRPFGNMAQPNHLATLIGLGLIAVVRLYELRRFSGITTAITAAFLGWGMVTTQSRTGWLFLALFTVWWAWNFRRLGLRLQPAAILAALLLFGVAVWAWEPLNNALLLSSNGTLEGRFNPGPRKAIWPLLLDAAFRHPWTGYGWSQVVVAQETAALDHTAAGYWFLQGHNLVLDLVLYNGIPIGIAVTGCLAWWFIRQIRACRSVEQWALLGSVAAIFAHALVEYPLHYAYFLLPAGLMMGALEALHPLPAWAVPMPRSVFAVVMAALAAMLFWIGAEYVQVESAVRQLRFVLQGIGVDKVPDAPLPDVRLLDEPRELHRFLLAQPRPGMTPDELEWMRRVSMREPRAIPMLRYALATGLNGRPQEAELTLRRFCKMHLARSCDEGRDSWRAVQDHYAVLRSIPYPDTPAELQVVRHPPALPH